MRRRDFRKQLVSALLSLAMVTGVCACGSDGETKRTAANVAGGTESVSETEVSTKDKKAANSDVGGADYNEHDGAWTILVYMCGSDLESGAGAATSDLAEMAAKSSGDCRFIVQTGGATEWQNEIVAADKLERYEVVEGDLKKISSDEVQSMADGDTLKDFVTWGAKNYGDGKLGLILWDHGGGSLDGVCVDEYTVDQETGASDTLSLKEIDTALSAVERSFDFVGFDACLMSTVETATMLSKHARYMIASEELESGVGWNYESILDAWAKDPGVDVPELGKKICDGFIKACEEIGEQDTCTLAVTDLSRMTDVVNAFDDAAAGMSESLANISTLGAITKNINRSENYGASTPAEGYTNLIDLGDMADQISDTVDTAALKEAIDQAVIYQVHGAQRSHAHGLSVYYPYQIQDFDEIDKFSDVSISSNYQYFTLGLIYGSINGSMEGFADEDSVDEQQVDQSAQEDQQFTSSENIKISLSEELHQNDDGYYTFTLDQDCIDYVDSVYYNLYMDIDGSGKLMYLGLDDNMDIDWDKGQVTEAFEGVWPCLCGSTFLTMYVVEQTDDQTEFSAPIYRNGKETNLRFVYNNKNEEWKIEGTWDGIDENGQSARSIVPLKAGDEICANYIGIDPETGETVTVKGDPVTLGDQIFISEEELPTGDYYYNFGINDIFGSTKYTDMLQFNVDQNGEVTAN